MSIGDLVRNKKIKFHSYGRVLDTDIDDYGKYNWDLIRHLVDQSGRRVAIRGLELETYLRDMGNIIEITNFVTQLWQAGTERYHEGIASNVEVDINAFDKYYPKPTEEQITKRLEQGLSDSITWVLEIPEFERRWNFSLMLAVGGMIGFPGYESPSTEEAFREEMRVFAESHMVGLPHQVNRYIGYALHRHAKVLSISNAIRDKPEILFTDPYQLQRLQVASMQTRNIAENVAHFGVRG